MTFRAFLKRLDLVTKLRRKLKKRRKCVEAGLQPPSLFTRFQVLAGDRRHDPRKATIILGLHEASRTGAPLLGLNLGEALAQRYNILYWLGDYGSILSGLKPSSFLIAIGFDDPSQMRKCLTVALEGSKAPVLAAVANSVECLPLAQAMDELDIPTVGLLHEFGEYTLPRTKMRDFFLACDRVVVPAQLLADSARLRIRSQVIGEPTHLVIRPQGYLPHQPPHCGAGALTAQEILHLVRAPEEAPRPKIVLGAGFVHARKGVDLFLQVAQLVRKRYQGAFRFIWVGASARAEEDLNYTFWLHDSIHRAGLDDTVFFLDVQKDLRTLLGLTDVFFLASRLDPFPNVVVDALESDRHVLCFDGATGAADFLRTTGADATVVDYLDLEAAAEAILRAFEKAGGEDRRNSGIVARHLSFAAYADFIADQLVRAGELKELRRTAMREITRSGRFDPAFAAGTRLAGSDRVRVLREFVTAELRGFHLAHPQPGFNAMRYRSDAGLAADARTVSVLHALQTHPEGIQTHAVALLDRLPRKARHAGRVGLHLHLHYGDLAREFAVLLTKADHAIDLFISVDSEESLSEVRAHFAAYGHGQVELRKVPNRGRDLGPLLTEFGGRLRNGGYDVVGHFHGKKSLQFPPAFGEAWRRFLVQTLIGDAPNLAKVLGLFADDPVLGLAFAEDHLPVGWGENLAPARSLADRMKIKPVLPAVPIFPVGTMFWARPEVLAPLWELGLDWPDYPREPLPDDGTLLHAIERMLPALAEAQGQRWTAIHRSGCTR